MKLFKTIVLVAAIAFGASAYAATIDGAKLSKVEFSDGSVFRGLSDNGAWAVAYGVNQASSTYAYPKIINVATSEITELLSADETSAAGECWVNDVTNDGQKVAGSYQGQPAVFDMTSKTWTLLTLPEGCSGGLVHAVTGDGHYAVGRCTHSDNWLYEEGAMWDLTDNSLVTLNNLPNVDMSGTYQDECRLTGISADGRYIVGCISFCYMNDTMYFMYDRQTETWDPIAFTYDNTGNSFTAKDASALKLFEITVSPNGKWVSGAIYTVGDAQHPFRYDTETKQLEFINDGESIDKALVCIDDAGNIYAATPAVSPYRSVYIYHGNYWYGLDELLEQRYGIDFYAKTGYDNTGTVCGVSADGKTLIANVSNTTENITLQLPETFGEACDNINLLSKYTVSPMSGSTITKVSNIDVLFNRNVRAVADKSVINLLDGKGNIVKSALKFEANASNKKQLNIGFRTTALNEGETYTIEIPAGAICVDGDESRTNEAFTITYIGHGDKPLQMVSVAPESGSMIGHISLTTNPILLTFDSQVTTITDAVAYLYRNEEAESICSLSISAGNTESTYNQVILYPVGTEYLYKGNTYRLVIPAGQITDLSGYSSNEEIVINYDGSYERTVISDDTHIYIENFVGGMGNVMLYDGDKQAPSTAMKGWGFVDDMAWNYAADDDYTNPCAVSHSMYETAGKSDDWMMTPQLFIPDDKCYISFKAQSYLSSKTDSLKVLVYECEETFNDLTEARMVDVRANAVVELKEELNSGSTDGSLKGDWTPFVIRLDKYAGKKIYIAFLNDNDNQSAVFVAEVNVVHAPDFQIALTGVPESVVNGTEQAVKGSLIINNEVLTFSSVDINLIDGNGAIVDNVSESGLNLEVGDAYDFEFTTPLALTVGAENKFKVSATLDGVSSNEFEAVISNLSFSPVKRVLLEEYTGQDCGNCPLGHLAIEKLEGLYGSRFIPVSYHVYTGDSYEYGMTDYAQYFLGLAGAPTAKIQRSAAAYSPMISTTSNGTTDYSFSRGDGTTWLDVVNEELSKQTIADLDVAAWYDAAAGTINVGYNCRFALDKANANYGLFAIITEDGLVGYQSNYFASNTDEDLGEWQSGGIYSQKYVYPYEFEDVACALYPANAYYGKSGLIPTSITNGEDYTGVISLKLSSDASHVQEVFNCKATLVLIDMNTGAVINVDRAPVGETAGIAGASDDAVTVTAIDASIAVGVPAVAEVSVYGVDGRIVARRTINGSSMIATDYRGVAIVKVECEGKSTVKKVVLK